VNRTVYTVTFVGDRPGDVQVGDELQIGGTVTVHSVVADLVDVSPLDRTEFLPGEVRVGLYSNRLEVSRP
jgi:hypothetical protein